MRFLFFLPLIFTMVGCSIYEEPPVSEVSGQPLCLTNYFGNIENIHPKVLYFKEGWNGYEFWMVYTPYPKGNIDTENPCVAFSHDGIHWENPPGKVNPLALPPNNGHNSDPHLVYDAISDKLECWWRIYDIPSSSDALLRRVSKDGVVWEKPDTVMSYGASGVMRLSPAAWIEDGCYKLVYSNGSRLLYSESPRNTSEFEWTAPMELPIDWGDLFAWHHDVVPDGEGNWDIVASAFPKGGKSGHCDLYYVKIQTDSDEAVSPEMILERSKNKRDFDYLSLYRPSLVKFGEEFFLYYSTISNSNHRYLALLRGYSLGTLRCLTEEELY